MLERQRTHRTPVILRTEQNYGPAGMRYFLAAVLIIGAQFILVGLGMASLVAFSNADGTPGAPTYVLLALALIVGSAGVWRAIQGARAGREFRNGRPFLKRG